MYTVLLYLLTAELCNALPECGDKGPMGVAQVGVEVLLVMGGEVGPPTAQPEGKAAAWPNRTHWYTSSY